MNNNPKTVEMKKQFDQKNKVNSKVHEVTTWLGNNCNTRIAQYLTKKRQTENEAGGRETSSRASFKKVLYEVKASGLQLSFNIFK